MTVLDRTVIFVVAVALLLLSSLIFGLSLGWNGLDAVEGAAASLQTNPIQTLLVAVLVVAVGLHLLFFALRSKDDGGRKALIHASELGDIRIGLRAVEKLVHRVARRLDGVREVDVRVSGAAEGIVARLAVTLAPDINIPQLSETLQRDVGQYIGETVGVPVKRVEVRIAGVAGETNARVQ